MASKIKVTKVTIAKTSIKKSPEIKSVSSSHVRPKAASSHVSSVKPGTQRIVPSNLKTVTKHPGQPTYKSGSMKTIRSPR